MLHATSLFSRIHFLVHRPSKEKEHVIIFFDNHAVQHLFSLRYPDEGWPNVVDLTDKSPFVGRTMRSIKRGFPYYQVDEVRPAINFFETEPDPATWVAGRLAFMKQLSCDRYIPGTLIKKLMEAK